MYLKILFGGGVLATCLTDSLFAGRPGSIDCHPDVVDGLSFLPFRNEGKEKGNETLLHYQLIGEGWLLLSHGCHHLAQVSRCLAGAKEGDVASQGFHLIYIYRQRLFFLGERLRCFASKRSKMSQRPYLRAFCKARKSHF